LGLGREYLVFTYGTLIYDIYVRKNPNPIQNENRPPPTTTTNYHNKPVCLRLVGIINILDTRLSRRDLLAEWFIRQGFVITEVAAYLVLP
jgi:hypothetical protein